MNRRQRLSDAQLLQEFRADGSQEAFSELIARHSGLVYSTSLRETHDICLAEDVTQIVFVLLARKAAHLTGYRSLTGWLFQAARFAARDVLKGEERRRKYEREAVITMETQAQSPDGLWSEIEPALQDALAALRANDRDAVLLRFYEGRSFSETGRTLGVSEEAARKRVERALERLRRYFSVRGVALTLPVLALLLTERAAHAAPESVLARATSFAMPPALSTATGRESPIEAFAERAWQAMRRRRIAFFAVVVLVASLLVAIIFVAAPSFLAGGRHSQPGTQRHNAASPTPHSPTNSH